LAKRRELPDESYVTLTATTTGKLHTTRHRLVDRLLRPGLRVLGNER